MNKILVIAPHPDDEVIGCGGTLAKHALRGDEVTVVVATNAAFGAPELYTQDDARRVRAEALLAHKVLGVKETFFLDFPAPALNAFPEYRMSLQFSKIFSEIRPTHLYIPHHGDIHQDHKAVYRAALVSARPQGDYSIRNIYCYETLSETEWAPMQERPFVPNHFVDITDTYATKTESMSCYRSQIRQFPSTRSLEAFEALAKFRGATVGVHKAEAFIVERQIDR